MNKELLEQLVGVRNELRSLAPIISWECCPKTERLFKKKVKTLSEIIKKIKAEVEDNENNSSER